MDFYGYSSASPLRGVLKGWTQYVASNGRTFTFNPSGQFMLWGYGFEIPEKSARTYHKFLRGLQNPSNLRINGEQGWLVHNLEVAFTPADANRVKSYYFGVSAHGWKVEDFTHLLPGCKDEPALICPAVLGILVCDPLVSFDHWTQQLIQFREFAYSLPQQVRDDPEWYTPRLWHEFDKQLSSGQAPAARSLQPQHNSDNLDYWYQRREQLNNQLAQVEMEIIRLGGST